MKRSLSSSNGQQPVMIAAVVAVLVLGLAAASTLAMAWGGWGMGWGDMGEHMRAMHGGGANTSNAPVTSGGATESVSIRDFASSPGNLEVPAGATVTWTNYDSAPHTATAKDGSWDTGTLGKGDSKSITFDKPGDYIYYCKVHPSMVARLVVK